MRSNDAVVDKVAEVESRCLAQKHPEPAEIPMPTELVQQFNALTINQVVDEDHPVIVARRKIREQNKWRRAAWNAECDEIARKSGLRDAEAEQNEMMNAVGDIAEQLLDLRAQTLAGMLVKIRVHERWTFNEDEILESLTDDIKAMAGGVS